MTDIEKFLVLYESFGINLVVKSIREEFPNITGNRHFDADNLYIEMSEGQHPKLVGYTGFLTMVYFDREGNFVEQGFWE